ncbi:ABC transporter ATP-binding protein [Lentilitoribacter sp. EG35]|uniref:ABC transporter ATP-binding protein n=1 Tax=Lentilitoribacter sp. EG35 TaxID=3234192 RepID=UPI0034608B95
MTLLLDVRNLQTWYGASQALFGVNLSINEGQVVSLMGRNGMGKSTVVKSIFGMMKTTKGSIKFQNQELLGQPSYKIARCGLGLVPEGRRAFGNLTVSENLHAASTNGPWNEKSIHHLFPRLGERTSQLSSTLSGGEQQMLVIARALMTNPYLLILDEATEGLAPTIRQEIWTAIGELKRQGISILVIDKTLKELIRISDHCVILERGANVWAGNPSDINENVSKRYLGV